MGGGYLGQVPAAGSLPCVRKPSFWHREAQGKCKYVNLDDKGRRLVIFGTFMLLYHWGVLSSTVWGARVTRPVLSLIRTHMCARTGSKVGPYGPRVLLRNGTHYGIQCWPTLGSIFGPFGSHTGLYVGPWGPDVADDGVRQGDAPSSPMYQKQLYDFAMS